MKKFLILLAFVFGFIISAHTSFAFVVDCATFDKDVDPRVISPGYKWDYVQAYSDDYGIDYGYYCNWSGACLNDSNVNSQGTFTKYEGTAFTSTFYTCKKNTNPTVTIAANKSTFSSTGEAIVLTWSTTDALSCTASGSWTGTKTTSGSATVYTSKYANEIYTLTCLGTNGQSAASSVTVNYSAPTFPAPTQCTAVPSLNASYPYYRAVVSGWDNHNGADTYTLYKDSISASNLLNTIAGPVGMGSFTFPYVNMLDTNYHKYIVVGADSGCANCATAQCETASVKAPVSTLSVDIVASSISVQSGGSNVTTNVVTTSENVTGITYIIYRSNDKLQAEMPSNTQLSIGAGTATSGNYSVKVTAVGKKADNSSITAEDTVNVIVEAAPTFPDLTAGSVTPSSASTNVATTFSADISNIGTSATSATSINHYFQLVNGTGKVATTSTAFAVNESKTVGASFTFSSSGTYYIRACADNNASFVGSITESNENNNCGDFTTVTVTTPPMSGTLWSEDGSTSCTISAGNSTCSLNSIMWNTVNPQATSAVYSPTNNSGTTVSTLVGSGNSGDVIATIHYPSRSFYLYNNAVLLSGPLTISAVCATGTTWTGSACTTNAVPTVIYPTDSSVGLSSVTLGANVSSLGVPASISERGICWRLSSGVYTAGNCAVEGGTSTGAFFVNVTGLSSGTDYRFKGYARNTTGYGYSTEGYFTTLSPAPTLNFSANPPSIVYNGTSYLTWSTTDATTCTASDAWTGTKATSGTNVSTGALTSSKTYTLECTGLGGSVTRSVTVTVGSAPVNGVCAVAHYGCTAGTNLAGTSTGGTNTVSYSNLNTNYGWICSGLNGGANASCTEVKTMSGTLSVPDCTILANASSCTSTAVWSTTNPQGTSAVTSSYPSANTTVYTGNSGSGSVTIPYPSRDFYLYNNGQLLASASGAAATVAACASGTAWNPTAGACKSYTVTGTAGTGGAITPASRTVAYGLTTTFTVTPNTDYSINTVSGCSGTLSGNTYTTGAITANCTVTATFSANTCANGATNYPTCDVFTNPLSISTPANSTITLPTTAFSASYTLTNGTGTNTDCYLLDNNQATLKTDISCTSPITYDTPAAAGVYGYYMRATKASTGETSTSDMFTVTVNDAPIPTFDISVNPTTYSVTLPDRTISATYTVTDGPASCRLLDNVGTPLNSYSPCRGSMLIAAPDIANTYGYSIQALKDSTGETDTSAFTVIVSDTPTCSNGAVNYSACTVNSSGLCINSATNPPTCTTFPPPAPTIISFTADPITIVKGESSTIKWSTMHADTCTSLTAGFNTGGAVSNSVGVIVSPTQTTTYRISCENTTSFITADSTVTVTVGEKKPGYKEN
ncbi:MAG: hypothetical protein NDI62_00255 [Burkholderiales bacterium]|nr:hypothetical protein [Burkholderiales bacterium]